MTKSFAVIIIVLDVDTSYRKSIILLLLVQWSIMNVILYCLMDWMENNSIVLSVKVLYFVSIHTWSCHGQYRVCLSHSCSVVIGRQGGRSTRMWESFDRVYCKQITAIDTRIVITITRDFLFVLLLLVFSVDVINWIYKQHRVIQNKLLFRNKYFIITQISRGTWNVKEISFKETNITIVNIVISYNMRS